MVAYYLKKKGYKIEIFHRGSNNSFWSHMVMGLLSMLWAALENSYFISYPDLSIIHKRLTGV